jgi:hypothetical protein
VTNPTKKALDDGAAALFERANPGQGALSKQPKATQETFRRYAHAAITGRPDDDTPDPDGDSA